VSGVEEDAVLCTVTPPLAHIELNRPTKLNAVDLECLDRLEEFIEAAELDSRVRAVIISGRGRCFCVGADLSVVEEAIAASAFDAFLRRWHEVFGRIERCTKPTIAAVHGLALAGGFELTQVCDLVVIGDATQIGDQHAKLGLFPGGGSTQRLPRLVGRRAATWMLLSGEAVTAERASALGLVNDVAPESQVLVRARTMAELLAERSVENSRAIKEAIWRGVDLDLSAAIDVERELAVAHMSSADAALGLAAFTSRSRPDFGYLRPAAG
jgi:enoyl-CoA hydratase/carnithine racemase